MKMIMIIILAMYSCFVQAGTYTVQIANVNNTKALSIINNLNSSYYGTGVKFELFSTRSILTTTSVTKTLFKSSYMNNQGADILIIVSDSHEGTRIGEAFFNEVCTNQSIAVVSNTSKNLIAHEVGHLFGLRHREGTNLMNSVVTNYSSKLTSKDIEIIKQKDKTIKPVKKKVVKSKSIKNYEKLPHFINVVYGD